MYVKQIKSDLDKKDVWVHVCDLDELVEEDLAEGTELNLLVDTGERDWETAALMFGPLDPGDLVVVVPKLMNWPRLLALLKCFSSANQAAKTLVARGRELEIATGWNDVHSEFLGVTERDLRFSVWKPHIL